MTASIACIPGPVPFQGPGSVLMAGMRILPQMGMDLTRGRLRMSDMVKRQSWEYFRATGMLWWANRILHVFGWAIVLVQEQDGKITGAYPARVRFRGFDGESESYGFRKVTKFMQANADTLRDEAEEE